MTCIEARKSNAGRTRERSLRGTSQEAISELCADTVRSPNVTLLAAQKPECGALFLCCLGSSCGLCVRKRIIHTPISFGLLNVLPTCLADILCKIIMTAIAVEVLKLAASAADAFGPLKSAAGGALHIIQLVQVRSRSCFCDSGSHTFDRDSRATKRTGVISGSMWKRISPSSYDASLRALCYLTTPRRDSYNYRGMPHHAFLYTNISLQYFRALESIKSSIELLQKASRKRRILSFLKEREKIKDMKTKLKEKLELFHVRISSCPGALRSSPSFHMKLEGAINVEIVVNGNDARQFRDKGTPDTFHCCVYTVLTETCSRSVGNGNTCP